MTLTEPEIGAFLAALVRTGGVATAAPVIGDRTVPVRARLVAVVAIALAVGANRQGVSYADLPEVAVLELAVGLLTGLTARFVLARAQVAGQLIGLSLGLGFASAYDAHAGESASTVSTLLNTLAGLAFLAAGGLEAIARGVAAAPAVPGQVLALGDLLILHGTAAMGQGLAIAAPVVIASLVANLGLAVLGRAAPSINMFSVSLAATIVAGGLALSGSGGAVIGALSDSARAAVQVIEAPLQP